MYDQAKESWLVNAMGGELCHSENWFSRRITNVAKTTEQVIEMNQQTEGDFSGKSNRKYSSPVCK